MNMERHRVLKGQEQVNLEVYFNLETKTIKEGAN